MDYADEVKTKRAREGLQNCREEALLSKELVTIDTDMEIETNFDDMVTDGFDNIELQNLFQELEFQALQNQIKSFSGDMPIPAKKPEKDLTSEHAKLPKPTGWRILVLPFKQKDKTKGGILITDSTIEKSQVASTCGLVLRMGPHCYDKERYPEGPWCKKGDWVSLARYDRSRLKIDGGELRLLNDDEILAIIQDPTDILHM